MEESVEPSWLFSPYRARTDWLPPPIGQFGVIQPPFVEEQQYSSSTATPRQHYNNTTIAVHW